MTGKRVKDFYRFLKSVGSFTDGQAAVTSWDEEELSKINLLIQPNDGPYEGGRFEFEIEMKDDFPETSPHVYCTTEVYHPNIDPTSQEYNVCLNLFDEWTSSYGLRDVVQGILFLMYNPNLDDPLSSYFGDTQSEDEFVGNVRTSLVGGDVDDYSFPWNYFGKDEEMLAKHTAITKQESDAKKEEKTSDAEVVNETSDKTDTDVKEDNQETTETPEKDNETEIKTLDVTVMLEKVSELMIQHPVEDENDETADAENNDNTDGNNNDAVTNEETTENVMQNADNSTSDQSDEYQDCNSATSDNVTMWHDCNSVPCDNVTINDNPLRIEMQRQSSKCDRQISYKDETDNDVNITGTADVAGVENSNTNRFAYYLNAHRTCTFVAPDFDHAMSMIGAICCYYVQEKKWTS